MCKHDTVEKGNVKYLNKADSQTVAAIESCFIKAYVSELQIYSAQLLTYKENSPDHIRIAGNKTTKKLRGIATHRSGKNILHKK